MKVYTVGLNAVTNTVAIPVFDRPDRFSGIRVGTINLYNCPNNLIFTESPVSNMAKLLKPERHGFDSSRSLYAYVIKQNGIQRETDYSGSIDNYLKSKGLTDKYTYSKSDKAPTNRDAVSAASVSESLLGALKTTKDKITDIASTASTISLLNSQAGSSDTAASLRKTIDALNKEDSSPRVISANDYYKKKVNYYNDYSEAEKAAIRSVYKSFNTAYNSTDYNNLRNDMLTAFNKYGPGGGASMADLRMVKGIPRVFFTRPDLNILENNSSNQYVLSSNTINDTWFQYLNKNNPNVLKCLTKNPIQNSSGHDFNPLLSNMALNFDINDEKLETVDHGETFTGWKVKYGRHTIGTRSAGSFSVSYNETDELEIYKIHKTWVDYISKIYRSEFTPKDIYIRDRRLDYAVSAYYFLCGPDGETILFWSKYIGVFPSSIPSGSLSWSKGDIVKTPEMNIEYEYAWKEDMELASIADFNYNAGIRNGISEVNWESSPYYDNEILGPGYAFAGVPYIKAVTRDDGHIDLLLKYKKRN